LTKLLDLDQKVQKGHDVENTEIKMSFLPNFPFNNQFTEVKLELRTARRSADRDSLQIGKTLGIKLYFLIVFLGVAVTKYYAKV